jgi:sterol desaturase/sphingolipid hydroxylase (fatty acid hydroxylase superfamily)
MHVPIIVVGVALLMIGYEHVHPGRSWPQVARWWLRVALLNSIQAAAVLLAGITWDRWFVAWRWWSADGLEVTGGAVLGYVVLTFCYYWWHRWRHTLPLLWRYVHQVHHSPQRLEVMASFYKHPLEMLSNSVLSSAILYLGSAWDHRPRLTLCS